MNSLLRAGLALGLVCFTGCAPTEPPIDPNKKSYFVDVEYTIGTDGKTKDAKIINTDAPQVLQKEALAEVYRWRAEPSADPSRARRRIDFAAEQ